MDDSDCAPDEQCLFGLCLPQLPGGGGGRGLMSRVGNLSCMTSRDCGAGTPCVLGYCIP